MENCRRRQRRKAKRPGDIIDAAFALFVRNGFHGVRIEDIARYAGLSNGALYNYFEGKQQVFDAVVRVKLMSALDELGEFSHRDGIASETLFRLADFLCGDAFGEELAGVFKMVIAEGINCPAPARFFYDEFVSKMFAILQSILHAGIENGEFKRVDVPATADILNRTMMASILRLSPFTCLFTTQVNVGESAHLLRCSLALMVSGLCSKDAG